MSSGLGVFMSGSYVLRDFGGIRLYSGDLTFVRLCGSLQAKITRTQHIYKELNDPNSYQNHIIITIIIKILKH